MHCEKRKCLCYERWKILEIPCICFQDGVSLGKGFVRTDSLYDREACRMTWVLRKEGRQIRGKLFSVQHLQASSNTSSSSCLNIFVPCECCTDKRRWKNSDVFIGPGFEARTSALYFIAEPSTRPFEKPQFPLKRLLRIVVIKYLGFIGFLSCRRLPWGIFSKGMEELTADCDRLRGNKVHNEFKPGGLWGSDLAFPLTHRSV